MNAQQNTFELVEIDVFFLQRGSLSKWKEHFWGEWRYHLVSLSNINKTRKECPNSEFNHKISTSFSLFSLAFCTSYNLKSLNSKWMSLYHNFKWIGLFLVKCKITLIISISRFILFLSSAAKISSLIGMENGSLSWTKNDCLASVDYSWQQSLNSSISITTEAHLGLEKWGLWLFLNSYFFCFKYLK